MAKPVTKSGLTRAKMKRGHRYMSVKKGYYVRKVKEKGVVKLKTTKISRATATDKGKIAKSKQRSGRKYKGD